MGKKKKSTSGPSKFAQPHINNALSSVNRAVNQNEPHLQQIASDLRGVFGNATDRFNNNTTLDNAENYNNQVLGGAFISGNPHLEGIIDRTSNDVTDRVNSIFSQAGRTGGYAHGEGLGDALSEAQNDIRYQDYDRQQSRQDQAASRATQLDGARNAGLASLNAAGANAAQLPYLGANTLSRNTAGLVGNSTTTTQGNNTAGNIAQGLGTALSVASLFSDRRLKTNVKKVGEMPDGLGVYEYDYIWGQPHKGVMADEVAKLRPWALGPIVSGFATVNYGAL